MFEIRFFLDRTSCPSVLNLTLRVSGRGPKGAISVGYSLFSAGQMSDVRPLFQTLQTPYINYQKFRTFKFQTLKFRTNKFGTKLFKTLNFFDFNVNSRKKCPKYVRNCN